MLKYIRWKGLAAFLIVLIVVGAFWFLFVDGIVKRGIEKYGTRAVGAKVNVANADLSLFPAGLELLGLQITNPEEPMKNAVEISKINMALDSAQLLRRKIIVREMTLEGVRFDTARKKSGAIKRSTPATVDQPSSQKKAAGGISKQISLPSLEVPSVKEILEKEKLQSLTLINSLQDDLQAEKQKWKQRLEQLPDKKKFEEYKARFKKIRSSKKNKLAGFLESAGEVSSLRNDIQEDMDRIKTAVDDFEKQLVGFQNRFNQISKAPLKDIERLQDKYSISSKGLSNMSRLLFSEQISNWVDKAVAWYARLQPMLKRRGNGKKGPEKIKPLRAKGVDVRFREYRPLPDFLIQQVKTNVSLKAGNLSGTIYNITPDQHILGQPLTFTFSGEKLQKIGAIKLTGKSDYVVPSRAQNNIDLSVQKLTISDFILSDDAKFPVSLKKALAWVDMQAVLRGNNIDSSLNAAFSGVELFSDPAGGHSRIASAMSSALSGVNAFKATVIINGTLQDYDVQIKSDIDRILKQAVGKIVRAESAKLQQKLKNAIFAKVNGPLMEAKSNLGSFGNIGEELNSRLGSGEGSLSGLKLPF